MGNIDVISYDLTVSQSNHYIVHISADTMNSSYLFKRRGTYEIVGACSVVPTIPYQVLEQFRAQNMSLPRYPPPHSVTMSLIVSYLLAFLGVDQSVLQLFLEMRQSKAHKPYARSNRDLARDICCRLHTQRCLHITSINGTEDAEGSIYFISLEWIRWQSSTTPSAATRLVYLKNYRIRFI